MILVITYGIIEILILKKSCLIGFVLCAIVQENMIMFYERMYVRQWIGGVRLW